MSKGKSYRLEVLVEAFPPPIEIKSQRKQVDYVQHPNAFIDSKMLTADDLGLKSSSRLRRLIESPRYKDRSRNALACVGQMVRDGYSDEQISGVLLNPANAVSAHILDQNNPMYQLQRCIGRARMNNGRQEMVDNKAEIWPELIKISQYEWKSANITPRVIIKNLIYQDVGTLIAAGGTGKTTLILWLSIHIILGFDFAKRKIAAPGPVVLLTAEDNREILIARLRNIYAEMFPMDVDPESAKFAAILNGMVIIDVSDNVRRLTCVDRDVVRVDYAAVDALTNLIADLSPSLVVIDPAVSFGVGEARVNDAEQGLIEAGRRIRATSNAAVVFVHHTGKAHARDKAEDQYAGRGGSAFADGSRMVFVLNRLEPSDWMRDTGSVLQPGETGLKMTIAKLSYARPQAPIYLVRKGYRIEHVEAVVKTDEDRNHEDDETVFAFLLNGLAKGEAYSRNTLENVRLNLSRVRIRAAVERLIGAGRLSQHRESGRRWALIPITAAADGEGA